MILMNEGLESLQAQIKELTAMVDENRTMLKSIQRRARVSILLSSIKWLFILGVTFGSFFFLQPLMDKAFSAYTSLSDLGNPFPKTTGTSTGDSDSVNQADGLVNALRAYMPR
jgi:hypothetical protein